MPAIPGRERTEQIYRHRNYSPVSGAVLQVWGNGGGPIDDIMLNPQAPVTLEFHWKSFPCLFPTQV